MENYTVRRRLKLAGKILLLGALAALIVLWLRVTPPGLLGKADAIGYAVCHRIAQRSFHIDERPLPLCARCTGMYLGALAGGLYQIRKGRRAGLPPLRLALPLAALALAFVVDGINSYLHFFPGVVGLYQPNNALRLVTGAGLGLIIPSYLLPAFHQTAWAEIDDRPALDSGRSLGGLLLSGGIVALLALSDNPLVLYPLALLESATVLGILTLCYGLLALIVTRGDGQARSLRDLWFSLAVGLFIALLQIGLVDWLRINLSGTWNGFTL